MTGLWSLTFTISECLEWYWAFSVSSLSSGTGTLKTSQASEFQEHSDNYHLQSDHLTNLSLVTGEMHSSWGQIPASALTMGPSLQFLQFAASLYHFSSFHNTWNKPFIQCLPLSYTPDSYTQQGFPSAVSQVCHFFPLCFNLAISHFVLWKKKRKKALALGWLESGKFSYSKFLVRICILYIFFERPISCYIYGYSERCMLDSISPMLNFKSLFVKCGICGGKCAIFLCSCSVATFGLKCLVTESLEM